MLNEPTKEELLICADNVLDKTPECDQLDVQLACEYKLIDVDVDIDGYYYIPTQNYLDLWDELNS